MSNIQKNSDKIPHPDQNHLKDQFDKYTAIRHSIVNELKERTEKLLDAIDSNPFISGRIKNFKSYYSKYLRLLKAGQEEPAITDLMGLRIICPFIEDLQATHEIFKKNFQITETELKGHDNYREFGYESIHLLIVIPQDLIDKYGNPGTETAEIQIRTILQDAWAEVEHELVYKAEFNPFDDPMRRKLAAVNASLSLADIIFQEIRTHQKKYSKEIEKRRESFYQKIEESTDDFLFNPEHGFSHLELNAGHVKDINLISVMPDSDDEKRSIDELLVYALSAHNQNRFNDAISQYTRILELKPANNMICSIIYKHRAMANFACSQYDKAIEDFTTSLELDPESYKTAYYRGVVRSVLKQYSHAIDDYTLSLTLYPYQSFCLFRRAQAFFHIGDYPGALSDCEVSLALEPDNKAALKFKDILHEKLKM